MAIFITSKAPATRRGFVLREVESDSSAMATRPTVLRCTVWLSRGHGTPHESRGAL